ncbi:nucleotidyltransferase family protein [Yeosuana marina]|uniref:nucleotidyltransferase family protein n=1 Tax=Yeosuana marina TaxID=1565536 RepID=UPI0030C7BECE
MSKLVVLILAAGNASRMGFPKQLLKWKNTNLLQHAINSVTHIENDGIFLVLGANYEKIISQINPYNLHVLKNDAWKQGLGSSISFGVQEISKCHPEIKEVLVMLADQPLIDAYFLNALINKHNESKNEITCTLYKDQKLGVPAIFNKSYFEELSQLNGDKGAKKILEKYSDRVTFIDGSHVISDIDSKEDYEVLFKNHH